MSISFDHVCFSYDGEVRALDDVCMTIEDGSFTGIIGSNASGKSTLVQLMNALLVPTDGTVSVDGTLTSDKKSRRLVRKSVGLVFQYPERQLFASTVVEDVAFGPRNAGLRGAELDERVREALTLVGLEYDEVARKSPFALSGGQQRRVAIAGTLALKPRVLVLDEPSAGMDPKGARELQATLRSLNRAGTTIVMVSHNMDEVAELCTNIVTFHRGKLVLQGTPQEVFAPQNQRALAEIGLDLPQATRFAIELSASGLELQQPVLTTEQLADAIARAVGK